MPQSVKLQLGKIVNQRIRENLEILEPVFSKIKPKGLFVFLADAESQAEIKEISPDHSRVSLRFPIDSDRDPKNGRLYIEDEFVLNPQTKELISYSRKIDSRQISGNWVDWKVELQTLPVISKNDPRLRRFFEKVILELPTLLEAKSDAQTNSEKLFIKEFPLRAKSSSLETEVFSSRALPLNDFYFPNELMRKCFLKFYQQGFQKDSEIFRPLFDWISQNPSSSAQQVALGLSEFSKGNFQKAHFYLDAIVEKSNAAATAVDQMNRYETAILSLRILDALQILCLQEIEKKNLERSFFQKNPFNEKSVSSLGSIFELLQKRILSGKVTNLKEALAGIDRKEDPFLLQALRSHSFLSGLPKTLIDLSSMAPSLRAPILKGVIRDRVMPLSMPAAQLLLDGMASVDFFGNEDFSFHSLELEKMAHSSSYQIDQTLSKVGEQFSNPAVIGSFFLGGLAFRYGQARAFSLLDPWRSQNPFFMSAMSSVAGLAFEVPTVEFSQRFMTSFQTRENVWKDLEVGLLRTSFSFAAFRSSQMFSGLMLDRLMLSKQKTTPLDLFILNHTIGLSTLHAVHEFERSAGMQPKDQNWEARFVGDTALYLELGAIGTLTHPLMGPAFPQPYAPREKPLVRPSQKWALAFEDSAHEGTRVLLLPPYRSMTNKGEVDLHRVSDPFDLEATPETPRAIPQKPVDFFKRLGLEPALPRDELGNFIISELPENIFKEVGGAKSQLMSEEVESTAALSHVGFGRKNNEDRFVIEVLPDGRKVLAAIDGMGGQENGEEAAVIAQYYFSAAIRAGESVEQALQFAHLHNRKYIIDTKHIDDEGVALPTAPSAVMLGLELIPKSAGLFEARFHGVGDCEALIIRPSETAEKDPEILYWTARPSSAVQEMMKIRGERIIPTMPDGRIRRENIFDYRTDENANVVSGGMGIRLELFESRPPEFLREGDVVLMGSDGFFENFGTLEMIAEFFRETPSNASVPHIRDSVLSENLLRMGLLQRLKASRKDYQVLTRNDYVEVYRQVTGVEPPADFKGAYEGYVLDDAGNVGLEADLVPTPVRKKVKMRLARDPETLRPKAIDHFKIDNTTLLVHVVGE